MKYRFRQQTYVVSPISRMQPPCFDHDPGKSLDVRYLGVKRNN